MMMSKITAPWDTKTVDALNRWQRAGFVHEFTCRNEHPGADRALVATVNGWICPHCTYTQDWAHDFMLIAPVNPLDRQRKSGAMPACSQANIVPVRPKPVMISSAIR